MGKSLFGISSQCWYPKKMFLRSYESVYLYLDGWLSAETNSLPLSGLGELFSSLISETSVKT